MMNLHPPSEVTSRRVVSVRFWCSRLVFVFCCIDAAFSQERFPRQSYPLGEAVLRVPAGKSTAVLATTPRLAGAIHSFRWDGMEFIDSTDHGRQLQSAANFDGCRPFFPETFNPTEAGSRRDGAGEISSSWLLEMHTNPRELRTTTQMAQWLAPGEDSLGHPALNDRVLSNHLLAKRVRIGWNDLPQVLDYQVTFSIPTGEQHTFAQFEALTGYMPAAFSTFWAWNAETGALQPLSDGPGEQPHPVVLATKNGSHAMGIYAPRKNGPGAEAVGYGRFRFQAERVTKWNCVFRVRRQDGVPAGEYRYQMFVPFGSLEDVRQSLIILHNSWRETGN